MYTFSRFLQWIIRGLWRIATRPFAPTHVTQADDEHIVFFSLPLFDRPSRHTVQDALAKLDYDGPLPPVRVFGGGMQSTRNDDLLREGYGAGGGRKLALPDSRRALVIGRGYGFAQVGRVFLRAGRLRVYPLAGIGGMGGGIVPATEDPDTPGTLTLDQQSAVDTGGGPLVTLALGADLQVGGSRGVVIGLRAGIIIPLIAPGRRRLYAHLTGGIALNRRPDTAPAPDTREW